MGQSSNWRISQSSKDASSGYGSESLRESDDHTRFQQPKFHMAGRERLNLTAPRITLASASIVPNTELTVSVYYNMTKAAWTSSSRQSYAKVSCTTDVLMRTLFVRPHARGEFKVIIIDTSTQEIYCVVHIQRHRASALVI